MKCEFCAFINTATANKDCVRACTEAILACTSVHNVYANILLLAPKLPIFQTLSVFFVRKMVYFDARLLNDIFDITDIYYFFVLAL